MLLNALLGDPDPIKAAGTDRVAFCITCLIISLEPHGLITIFHMLPLKHSTKQACDTHSYRLATEEIKVREVYRSAQPGLRN